MKTQSLLKPPESKVLKSGRVVLFPGEEVGEHITENKEEVLVIIRGTATLREDDKETKLNAGETHYIAENVAHNVLNNSDEELEYVYVVGLIEKK